jgi:hypothetical protein
MPPTGGGSGGMEATGGAPVGTGGAAGGPAACLSAYEFCDRLADECCPDAFMVTDDALLCMCLPRCEADEDCDTG